VTQHVLLTNTDHRDLRVITTRAAAYGDDVMYAMTFPSEFRNVQAHYPIVFGKGRDNSYAPLALLGFRDRQNLFLRDGQWDASYLPILAEHQPFLIGQSANGKVIHIDLDSPRVSRTEGERLFDDNGGSTEFLQRKVSLLAAIDEGVAAIPSFIAALEEFNLLEGFALDIKFADGGEKRLTGFHTIQEDRLKALGAEALGKLHAQGHLQSLFMVIASLANFRGMIDRASRLDAAQR
jgi:hypothetical protein